MMRQTLVLDKFGKAECGGGGLLDLIARAIERDSGYYWRPSA
jgi:hypothetical protein